MCGSLILGTFFVMAGISIFVNVIFGINIPFGRIFFGLLMLYIGFMFISGFSRFNAGGCCAQYRGSAGCHSNCLGKAEIIIDAATVAQQHSNYEYSTILGSSIIDLSHLRPEDISADKTPLIITANTVLGKTDLKINKNIATRINAHGVLSGTNLPDGTAVTMGSHIYSSHAAPVAPQIVISTNTVLGGLEVVSV